MNTKVRPWHLVTVAAGVAGGVWFLMPPAPPPPDFSGQGFVSVHAHLRGNAEHYSPEERAELAGVMAVVPPADGSSGDPAVVAELAEVLRSGRPVVVCRCAVLGSLEFHRPDGTAERVPIVPAHDDGSVEFRFGGGPVPGQPGAVPTGGRPAGGAGGPLVQVALRRARHYT